MDVVLTKQIILKLIKDNQKPLPFYVLMKILINHYKKELGYIDQQEISNLIDELAKDKTISKIQSKKSDGFNLSLFGDDKWTSHTISGNKQSSKGFLHVNANGNGFISLNEKQKAIYFVKAENLHNAQNGDYIEFDYFSEHVDEWKLIPAIVTNIVQHSKDLFVGEIIMQNDKKEVKIDDDKFNLNVILDTYDGLVNGTKVLIKIEKYENDKAYASVFRNIGHKSDVGVDIESIVYDNGVTPIFLDEVIEYSKNIKVEIDDYQRKIRVDITNKPVVTIDPATSKDFDDAFYCEKTNDNKFLLAVQIADVSHYVKYESILDKSSIDRGCSIYLIDRVIPMVPHNLSDDICSLNPKVERLTLSCDMIINDKGEFESIKVFPSIIKSHRRFSYDEINDYINKETNFNDEEIEVKKSIDVGLKLSDILTKMKNERGYINFEIPKAVIKVNDKGEPIEISKETHGRAQKMIEDFMVAANEAVTIYANKNNFPFVYRVHDKPKEESLRIFSVEAKKMNFKITTSLDNIEPDSISKWLVDNKDNPNLELINMFLLRSMAKAKYDTKNIGHFGLASQNYTHFTSPIRRYPDLIVHRIFWMWDFLKDETKESQRQKFANELQELAEISSRNELRSVKCEREVDSMEFAEYMMKFIGKQFKGTVTNIANFGCYVQLENTIEGFVNIRNIGEDFFSYEEKSNELIGKNKGMRIMFGKKVTVEVIAADKNTRKIEFKIIS